MTNRNIELDDVIEEFFSSQLETLDSIDGLEQAMPIVFWIGVVLSQKWPRTGERLLATYFPTAEGKNEVSFVTAKAACFTLAEDLAEALAAVLPPE